VITLFLTILVTVMAEAPLAGVPNDRIGVLTQIYSDAQHRIRQIVLNPKGRTEGSRDYRQMRAAQQIRQIDGILDSLGSARETWAGSNAPAAYERGLQYATTEAADLGVNVAGSPVKASFSEIDRSSIDVLATDIATDLANADASIGQRAKLIVTRTAQQAIGEAQLNRILAGGIIDGTPVDTIRQLREALKAVAGETISIPTRTGGTMEFETAHYARLVAITKTREAMERGRHNRLSGLGIDLVKVVGTFSGNFCTAYLGKVFSISGSHPTFPALDKLPRGGPPFHPFCGKSTAAFVEDLATQKELAEARGLADADKLLGVNAAEAQRRFKSLGLQQQVLGGYAKGFTPRRTAGTAEQEPARTIRRALSSPAPKAAPTAPASKAIQTVVAGGKRIDLTPPANFDGRRQSVVWINLPALDKAMKSDPLYVGPGGEGGVKGRYEAFAAFVAKPNRPPVEMSRVALLNGEPSITDGRHRLAWFRDQGVTALPVVIAKGQAAALARSFGPGVKARA
jgi:hypothetical protein